MQWLANHSQVLLKRFRKYIDAKLREELVAFRNGRSSNEQDIEQSLEYQKPLIISYADHVD